MSDENPKREEKVALAERYSEAFRKVLEGTLYRGGLRVRRVVLKDDKVDFELIITGIRAGHYRDVISFAVEMLRRIYSSLGRKTIKKAPGYSVLAAAEFLCGPKTIDQVFEPLVSDWQEEYFAALNQNRWVKAKWISLRYMWKAVLAFGLSKLLAAVRAVFSTKR